MEYSDEVFEEIKDVRCHHCEGQSPQATRIILFNSKDARSIVTTPDRGCKIHGTDFEIRRGDRKYLTI
ncbi:MAG: hypothetical protein A3J72_04550 [Nitrospirae bacterium RIFCSPHIGHO2_02_FULL_40_19]|nr:MAG: hypothetical protein A3J72_04550 [Nitrospirae bacterium RIFCSPHIGHO2_02_FULL_40_19]